jgi:hypothetical protein
MGNCDIWRARIRTKVWLGIKLPNTFVLCDFALWNRMRLTPTNFLVILLQF